jgi:hypothetical protein
VSRGDELTRVVTRDVTRDEGATIVANDPMRQTPPKP